MGFADVEKNNHLEKSGRRREGMSGDCIGRLGPQWTGVLEKQKIEKEKSGTRCRMSKYGALLECF
jgi:hypothetical protein